MVNRMEVKFIKKEKDFVEIEFVGADIAIPQLIVAKLNEDKGVEFAGFKKEHPIVGNPKITVKSKKKDAAAIVLEKIEEIEAEVEEFKKSFK